MPDFRLPPYRVEAVFLEMSETIDWGLSAYNIPAHWQQSRGRGIKVAVLDTGIDSAHPDLHDAIDDLRDFTGSPFGPADRQGHGTHTAGTIAARQNDSGVVGVAPDCRLLVGKVLGDDGSGSGANVAAGIDWACDSGADIISMSLGAPQPDPQILAAIERAVAKGKFVICAAGNDGFIAGQDAVGYPARWKQTIAVAAVDRAGRLCDFSSQGSEVDIAAPGQDVLSTYPGGRYAKLSGTSMATPFVAGVTALLLAAHRQSATPTTAPLETVDQLRTLLASTAIDAGPTGHDPGYGWGLVNPDGLLPLATTVTPPPTTVLPPPATSPTLSLVLSGVTLNGLTGRLVASNVQFQPQP